MDARRWGAAIILFLLSLAPVAALGQYPGQYPGQMRGPMPQRGLASARSQNFLVSTVDREFANQLVEQAEKSRRELAIEFFGKELPPLQQPIALTAVDVGPNVPASGVTEFGFRGSSPYGFTMVVAGSKERILDSVLPHEVLHTVFATFFGRPVIRWADEGCCTTVEHGSERAKQDKLLIEFLHTDRGIAFNKMFHMKNYPRDMLPLYSQGYSLSRYLIAQGGKQKFMQYLAKGMSREQWDAVTKEFYGYEDLSELQITWLDWVRKGSPDDIASRTPSGGNSAGVGEESLVLNDAAPLEPAPSSRASRSEGPGGSTNVVASVSYYEQRKNASPAKDLAKPIAGRTREIASAKQSEPITSARPNEPQKVQQRPLAWGEGAASARPAPVTRSLPAPRPSDNRGYEPPDYRGAVKSASSGWSKPTGTVLR